MTQLDTITGQKLQLEEQRRTVQAKNEECLNLVHQLDETKVKLSSANSVKEEASLQHHALKEEVCHLIEVKDAERAKNEKLERELQRQADEALSWQTASTQHIK